VAGDEIVVERAGADGLRRGDIVLYTVGGTFHTHRLLSKRRRGSATLMVTKGDASLHPDLPWREEQLLGRVVAIGRESRTIDLGSGKWRAISHLLGVLAALQVAVFRVACRMKRIIIGRCPDGSTSSPRRLVEENRRSWWTPWLIRIISAPSRWLIRLAQ
jgi:hypothetical protein